MKNSWKVEPLDTVIFNMGQLLKLCDRSDFSETGVIAALYLARDKLNSGWLKDE